MNRSSAHGAAALREKCPNLNVAAHSGLFLGQVRELSCLCHFCECRWLELALT